MYDCWKTIFVNIACLELSDNVKSKNLAHRQNSSNIHLEHRRNKHNRYP